MNSLAGHFLIATPQLADPNFRRSVILIIKHDDEGAMGLVVNRPAPLPFKLVWEKLSDEPCPTDAPLYVGGPCGGPLMALHNNSDYCEYTIFSTLHFTADIQHIRELLARNVKPLRLFGGYSGWGAGQLEGELAAGGWYLAEGSPDLVFATGESLWDDLVKRVKNGTQLSEWLNIREIPPEPWMN